MITLSQLRLYDWYAFRMEMRNYCRKDLLQKGREYHNAYFVYFIFDGEPGSPEARPIYIGCTGSFYWRMVKHTHKITPQARIYSKAFASKVEALRYERRCIKAWHPKLNIKHNNWWQYDLIG